jgi:hypothetical protein
MNGICHDASLRGNTVVSLPNFTELAIAFSSMSALFVVILGGTV